MSSKFMTQGDEVGMTMSLREVELRVKGTVASRVSELRLIKKDKGIVLRGFARTYHAKQVAQHAVMSATRVPILANEIEVA